MLYRGRKRVGSSAVGIVANPLAGRDVRRLVAQASVFPNSEKAKMIQRLLAALGAVGVTDAFVSTDVGGISAAVLRSLGPDPAAGRPEWPTVHFVELERYSSTAADTAELVGAMMGAGVGAIVCLGGDGTARAVAASCGDTPLLALSTGTNNVFPEVREATVAGLAAGLVAQGAVDATTVLERDARLEVIAHSRVETALVDVCLTRAASRGARALWDVGGLTELACVFARPDAIGLSSIPGLLCPVPRGAGHGVVLRLVPPRSAPAVVRAPIAPGLVVEVGVASWEHLHRGRPHMMGTGGGVVALDGEREIELDASERVQVRFCTDGPVRIDPSATLAEAAQRRLLCTLPAGAYGPGLPPSNDTP
jgi:hypothetical protein